MANKNRTDLKSYFVKNAIPTEGNFADLIDSQLNQAQDGVFKLDGQPLSVVAAAGDQRRALRLYSDYPAANADWLISLKPAQDPADAATCRPGFGVADGAGNTRLFIEAGTGRIGIGTNTPQQTLDIAGTLRANGLRGRNDLVLNDYRTPNPNSNVCLHAPAGDRDAWIYRDGADPNANWGIYHRQINTPIAGLPGDAIAFVGASRLQAYVGLTDGSAFFAGTVGVTGQLQANGGARVSGNAGVLDLVGSNHLYMQFYPLSLAAGRKGWLGYGGSNTTTLSVTNEAGPLALNALGGVSAQSGLIVDGGVAHLERDGAFYRNTDGQVYLTVDDNLFIRNLGSGTWAAHFNTAAGNLITKGVMQAAAWRGAATNWNALGGEGTIMTDVNDYKAMMIVGSNQNQGKNRWVRMWDYLTVHGGLQVDSDIEFGATLQTPGRMHITGGELCYMLHKNGVIIGKEWGGSGNLSVQGSKNFHIDHPLDPERYLVHSVVEGPEAAVFYRGEAALMNGQCQIQLPPYFEALTRKENRTVLLTPKLTGQGAQSALAASAVADGRFTVRAIDKQNPTQTFYWEVKGVRADIDPIVVEPLRSAFPPVASPPSATPQPEATKTADTPKS